MEDDFVSDIKLNQSKNRQASSYIKLAIKIVKGIFELLKILQQNLGRTLLIYAVEIDSINDVKARL